MLSLKDKVNIIDSLINGETGRKLVDTYLAILRKYVRTHDNVSCVSKNLIKNNLC